jgi:hypothetical protein
MDSPHRKVKQNTSFAFLWVLYAPELALLKGKVSVHNASCGCPPRSSAIVSSSCGKPPAMTGLYAMTNMLIN